MAYELLRYGESFEQHIVAEVDTAGKLLGFLSVRQEEVDPYSEHPSIRLDIKDLGQSGPRFTRNDLDASTGTAAELKYTSDTDYVSTTYQFGDPTGLVTLQDVVTLADYERALRCGYGSRDTMVLTAPDSWSAEDFIDFLEDLPEYVGAGNMTEASQVLKFCMEYAPHLYDEELNDKIAEMQQLIAIN